MQAVVDELLTDLEDDVWFATRYVTELPELSEERLKEARKRIVLVRTYVLSDTQRYRLERLDWRVLVFLEGIRASKERDYRVTSDSQIDAYMRRQYMALSSEISDLETRAMKLRARRAVIEELRPNYRFEGTSND